MDQVVQKSPSAASGDWVDYFHQNALEPLFPWNTGARLSGAEKRAVIPSIQQFQLGEGASGARMLKRAQHFSQHTGDIGLTAALKLFLIEEQRHSWMLARFLELENEPCLRKHWVHTVFRSLRGLAGLELCLKVLVTAEILARPYYSALRDATGSALLSSISQRIFEEEAAHLRFQAFVLQRIQDRRHLLVRTFIKTSHAALLASTAILVWREHQAVFKSAGRTFRQFWRETWLEFETLYRWAG